ncbi:Ribosomal RNA small subunit methyltransferase B [Pontiella desulfatans]|uniref:Ribosomal RNA small subunit methyltransferase B n=1 Tax=Pontiella desulfatans TaxID=2750659 RepID=A0A6C2UDI9_PONDE|nr:class I SAM-dependent methyltransferase [Pontiella desulfatans]VGO17617.1 Ribosomal RNA small subunit methyltransferase B [Pontiella desulfatans]
MDNNTQPKPLPEKVVRRHAEMIGEILPDFTKLVVEEGRPADAVLNAYLRTHRELGSRDRRFLSQAIFSYFRWYGWTVSKLQLDAPEAVLVGVALDLAELPQSFEFLAGRCQLPFTIEAMGGKGIEENRCILNERFKERQGFEPLELTDLVLPDFASVVDPEKVVPCINEFQARPPTWIRSRTEPETLISALAEQQIEGRIHDQVPTAISLEGGQSLGNALSGKTNQFVVQDIASQCVGLACAPQKGGDWWDCCAGAGGKALHLMDLMEQDGKVLATDVRIPPLKELKKRARRYGIKNIRTQTFNAVNDEPFTKTFDGVLADAPCSGWGTWSRNPDARWRASKRDVMQCASRQLKILNNVKWCVKPGGLLVYAVCTITRPETEEVVMNFLDQHSNFKLAPFTNPITGKQTNGQMQVWPWEAGGDGMFIARFVRDVE